jgi:hypothetical protein
MYWKFGVSFPLLAIMAWERTFIQIHMLLSNNEEATIISVQQLEKKANCQLDCISFPMACFTSMPK